MAAAVSGRALLAFGLLCVGSGCGSGSFYYWGSYESSVLLYGEGLDDADRSAQVDQLMGDVARAQEKGKPLPPGFHAHLGQLLLEIGDRAGAQVQFELERERFPQSEVFMDWVLARLEAQP